MPPKILIAEDNDTIATALEGLLQRKGMRTERAADGVKALSRIVATPPDALILDLQLPGLHGIELLKKLRQSPRTRELPVVIVTGVYRGDPYISAARALGVTSYLEKPFRAADILAAVHQALGTPAPAETPPPPRELPMDRHLLRAFTSRFSGTYLLKNAEGERSLVFFNGLPVSLRPGFSSLNFGDYLRRRGLISAEEYAYYTQAGAANHELLVEMGCLEYPELLQEKFAYLSGELVDAFGAAPMTVEERPTATPEELQVIAVNVPNIFYQGYRRHLPPARQQALGERLTGKYLAPGKNFYRFINFLTLSEEEKGLLHRLDGTRTLGEALEEGAPLPPLIVTLATLEMIALGDRPLTAAVPDFPLRALFNAYQEEIAVEIPADEPLESFSDLVDPEEEGDTPVITRRPIPPPPPGPGGDGGGSDLARKVRTTLAGIQGKNYYETFGMTQGKFSFATLKERYFALTREFGPETLMQLSGEEAAMVEEILSSVATAYNTLSDVVKKERYDELLGSEKVGLGQAGDDRFQAQIQAQSGKVFLEMEEWDNAEKALQDACNIDPQNGDYLAHLAWAIYRNPKNLSSRAMQDKSRQMLNRALTLDRGASAFAFKGYMLFEAGQDSLAEGEFNKALKLDARQAMARRGLRELLEKREQEKKGLFRRMFR